MKTNCCDCHYFHPEYFNCFCVDRYYEKTLYDSNYCKFFKQHDEKDYSCAEVYFDTMDRRKNDKIEALEKEVSMLKGNIQSRSRKAAEEISKYFCDKWSLEYSDKNPESVDLIKSIIERHFSEGE